MVAPAPFHMTEPVQYVDRSSPVGREAKPPITYPLGYYGTALDTINSEPVAVGRAPIVSQGWLTMDTASAPTAKSLYDTGESVGTESFEGSTTTTLLTTRYAGVAGKSHLSELPRPKRMVTTFEPHLRISTVNKLLRLIGQLRNSMGQPVAAAAKAELREALTDAYKRSALDLETRNFATAISLLQDFLRPHWSEISSQKLDGVAEKLADLSDEKDLNPRILKQFYRHLVIVLGGRIQVETEADTEETDA